jgi:hypothetical protein
MSGKKAERKKPVAYKLRGGKLTRKGPEPERLKINMGFGDAVSTALKKKRPAGGWPK